MRYDRDMNYRLLLSLLFELLQNRRVAAPELAQKYGVSPRTIYRYVDKLAAVLPLRVERGRKGGVYLSDSYRLPVGFFTEEEFSALNEALTLAYENSAQPRFLTVLRKLTQTEKDSHPPQKTGNGNIYLLPVEGEEEFARIWQICHTAAKERKFIKIEYGGLFCIVEPHALFERKGEWFLRAFCHTRKQFHSFALRKIRGVFALNERFRARPFSLVDDE